MEVVRRRQARADVEELPQADAAGQEPDCAANEGPVLARGDARVGDLSSTLAAVSRSAAKLFWPPMR